MDAAAPGAVQRPGHRAGQRALVAVRRATDAARAHPRLSLSALAWAVGLFLAFVPAALTSSSPAAAAQYTASLDKAALLEPALHQARRKAAAAAYAAREQAGWGWRWGGEEKRAAVLAARAAAADARDRVRAIEREMDGHLNSARSALGLWSEAGVAETRAAFKAAFQRGHVIGKRQTLWDGATRIIFGGRDEDGHPLLLLFELVLLAVINFSVGMVWATLGFVAGLPALILSYSPGVLSGLAFAVVAVLGALSVVSGFLALLAGGGVAVVAGAAALTAPPARLGRGGEHDASQPRVTPAAAAPPARASRTRQRWRGPAQAARGVMGGHL